MQQMRSERMGVVYDGKGGTYDGVHLERARVSPCYCTSRSGQELRVAPFMYPKKSLSIFIFGAKRAFPFRPFENILAYT